MMVVAALLFIGQVVWYARPLLSMAGSVLLPVATPYAPTLEIFIPISLPRMASRTSSLLIFRIRTSQPLEAILASFTRPPLPLSIAVMVLVVIHSLPFPMPLIFMSMPVRSGRVAIIHCAQPQSRFKFLFLLQCKIVTIRLANDVLEKSGIWFRGSRRRPGTWFRSALYGNLRGE